jgi:serine/threonine-protein kinase
MELLKGEDLSAIVESRGRMPGKEVVTLLFQAALALDKTHAAGIVHRDLKPENMFITYRDDGSPRLKILDFGIAKVVAQNATNAKTTRSMGTPLYMSPEQVSGDGAISPRADLYALGQIAYTLLVGKAYFDEDLAASNGIYPLLLKIAQGMPDPASVRAARAKVKLPKGFDAWFERATARSPSARFKTASELVQALAEMLKVPMPKAVDATGKHKAATSKRAPKGSATNLDDSGRKALNPGDKPRGNNTHAAVTRDHAPKPSNARLMGVALVSLGLGVVLWMSLRPSAAPAGATASKNALTSPAAEATASSPSAAPSAGAAITDPSASASVTAAPSASAVASASAGPSASATASPKTKPRSNTPQPRTSLPYDPTTVR